MGGNYAGNVFRLILEYSLCLSGGSEAKGIRGISSPIIKSGQGSKGGARFTIRDWNPKLTRWAGDKIWKGKRRCLS